MPEEPEVFKKLAEAEAAPDLSVPFTGSYEMNQQIIEHRTSQHSISACLEVLQTNVIIIIITTSHR